MEVWIALLVGNVLMCVIMLMSGWMCLFKAPKKINMLIGYRTRRSMKNEETWLFAHHYVGRLLWKWGWVSLPVVAVSMLLMFKQPENVITILGLVLTVLIMVLIIASALFTERALKKYFDAGGNRIGD